MPETENSTDVSMSTTNANNEWDYGRKSLTTAKIIFISVFGEHFIPSLAVSNQKTFKSTKFSHLSRHPNYHVDRNCGVELEDQAASGNKRNSTRSYDTTDITPAGSKKLNLYAIVASYVVSCNLCFCVPYTRFQKNKILFNQRDIDFLHMFTDK